LREDISLLLSVRDLRIQFRTFDGIVHAVNGVSFDLDQGETLGIVGESGSGKSVATHAILQLVPRPPGEIVGGEILFGDRDLLKLSESELNRVRGREIGMIFQEPMTSLNPLFTIENQMGEMLKTHISGIKKSETRDRVIDALRAVGIPSPESRLGSYPHELSGGMRQRVMIAMALLCEPKLLIADEPTTALDVTIQAQILEIINNLQQSRKLGVILITHDLGVIAETARRVAVMYAGKIVEMATTSQLFTNPRHPYTMGLLQSIPSYADSDAYDSSRRLSTIHGIVPDLRALPQGCPFANRCAEVSDECRQRTPELRDMGQGHLVSCLKRG
jgi:oligopeptide/dipeptide ABC transporter ATP-binding protein